MARRLHFLGYGKLQMRDRTELSAKVCGEIKLEMDTKYPAFVDWRELIRHQAAHDRFLQNTFGRRAWGVREGKCERFLLQSEITDHLLAEAVRRKPYALTSDGFLEVT